MASEHAIRSTRACKLTTGSQQGYIGPWPLVLGHNFSFSSNHRTPSHPYSVNHSCTNAQPHNHHLTPMRTINLRWPGTPTSILKHALAQRLQPEPAPRPVSWACQQIHETLQRGHLGKWGWVIYRTSYKDDAAWDRFQRYVNEWSRETLRKEGASPLVSGTVDWTFVSDPALDGVSREELCESFHQWRRRAMWTENPRMRSPKTIRNIPQRYIYFVRADEDALNSVARGSTLDQDAGAVQFVQCMPDRPCCGFGDGEAWTMLSKKVVSTEFWDQVGTSIWDPDAVLIDEVMEDEFQGLEWERKREREGGRERS